MRLVAVIVMLLPLSAQAARLQCPARAPADWGVAGPLVAVGVLSERKGVAIDEAAPPLLVPDRGFARGTVWHNVWAMGDEPGWVHFIQCQWRGSPRILRLPADGLKRCEQTAAPYSAARGVAGDAVHTLTCE